MIFSRQRDRPYDRTHEGRDVTSTVFMALCPVLVDDGGNLYSISASLKMNKSELFSLYHFCSSLIKNTKTQMPSSVGKQNPHSDGFTIETQPMPWSGVTDRWEPLKHVERLLTDRLD